MSKKTQIYEERLDLRLELRVKNNVLWHAIYDQYKSVAAFCRVFRGYGFQPSLVGDLLRFKASPWLRDGTYRKVVYELASVLGIPEEELFPQGLYERVTNPVGVIEVSSFAALPGTIRRELLTLPAPAHIPDSEVLEQDQECDRRLEAVLRTLFPREREVLKHRFGLMGETPKTLEQIGQILGITKELVRQAEMRALRKLERSPRADILAPLLDERARARFGFE